jgi:3-hydroxy acid dehydrogenase/malonic semialdehyde reductase
MEGSGSEVELTRYPRLTNKIVLITGASAGIGEACARIFALGGSHLVLGARRVEKVEALAKALSVKHNIRVHAAALDVRDAASIDAFFASLPEEFQKIDILINNAGLALGRSNTWETLDEDIDGMLDTNVKGLLRVTKAVVPGMRQRNSGHVINISSVAGVEAYRGGSVYCASKFAVQAITTALRKELVDTPIRVTGICPGLVETEFSLVRFKGDAEKAKEPYKGLIPLSPFDVADVIAFTASRPEHVQVADVLLFPSAQASSEIVHRS